MELEPNAGGRRADDPPGLVVPLKDYLEDKIEASHNELKAEIGHLRVDMAEGNTRSTAEHAEVNLKLTTLGAAVGELVAQDNREQGARAIKRTIWKAAAAIVAALAALAGIAAAVSGLFG